MLILESLGHMVLHQEPLLRMATYVRSLLFRAVRPCWPRQLQLILANSLALYAVFQGSRRSSDLPWSSTRDYQAESPYECLRNYAYIDTFIIVITPFLSLGPILICFIYSQLLVASYIWLLFIHSAGRNSGFLVVSFFLCTDTV